MLVKTRGIVISHIRFQETSIIVKIYTEELGIQSYIVNGVRSKSAKTNKIALFQSLTLLDLVVYNNERKSIQRIAEQKCAYPFSDIPFNLIKSSIAMFVDEVLNKVLSNEEESNPVLFSFLYEKIKALDESKEHLSNFHILFLLELLVHLGIQPLSSESMYEGITSNYQGKNHIIVPTVNENIFIDAALQQKSTSPINSIERRNILQFVLNFYYSQIENFGVVRSKDILSEIFN